MRTLIVPMITGNKNPMSDSGFFVAWSIAEAMVARGSHVYLLMPDNTRPWQDQFTKEGVTVLFSGQTTEYYWLHWAYVDTQLVVDSFSPVTGRYFIDAAITFSGEHSMMLSSCLNDYKSSKQIPIYTYSHGAGHPDTMPSFVDRVTSYRNQAFGFAITYPVMCSEREFSVVDDSCKRYGIGVTLRKEMAKNRLIAYPPLDVGEVLEHGEGVEKSKDFTLLYAARFNSIKRVERIVEVYDTAYKMGLPVAVKVLTPTPAMKAEKFAVNNDLFEERGYIEPIYSAGRDEFYKAAAESHLYVMWSTSEVMPLALMEAMLLGCIPMVHREVWTESVFGDWEDDLFWFTNKKDLLTKIRYCVENYEEARERLEPYRQTMIERVGLLRVDRKLADQIVSGVDQAEPSTEFYGGLKHWVDREILGMAKTVLKTKETLTFPIRKFLKGLLACSDININSSDMIRYSSNRQATDYGMYRLLKFHYGLVDDETKTRNIMMITPEVASELKDRLSKDS